MNRIDRVSAILIQLQSRKLVKAQDIAERFGISLRTVYRDIRTLEEAGVPVIGEAGAGYTLMDGYRLPPVMFTREEAAAFITAEKLVERLTDGATEKNYQSALFKIKAVLRGTEKDHLAHIADRIAVVPDPYLPGRQTGQAHNIPLILESIGTRTVLQLKYFAIHSQEISLREVEPVGTYYSGSNWYLVAFCRLRNDYRNFRLDRVEDIRSTGQSFHKIHPALKEFLEKIKCQEALHSVVMQMDKGIVRYLGDQKYYNGYVSERKIGSRVEMTFLTASLYGFARWYMMFGDMAEIISPVELKDMVRKLAADIALKTNRL